MTKSVILMSAILPTTGHLDLIRFASMFSDIVDVIVHGRTKDPISLMSRCDAIKRATDSFSNHGGHIDVIPLHLDGLPESPKSEDDDEFWQIWSSTVRNVARIGKDSVFVASELYGIEMAKRLGIKFVPYDIARSINPVKGTAVRQNAVFYWNKILPDMRSHLATNVVLFGQESVGKTTIARELKSAITGSKFIPEYAREYLEAVGHELNDEKMKIIATGQYGLQKSVIQDSSHCNIFDTDLLSTYGYHEILGNEPKQDDEFMSLLEDPAFADFHYFLLPDNVSFVADQLRYGGDKRESTMSFWKDILDETGKSYTVVPDTITDIEQKVGFIQHHCELLISSKLSKIERHVR